jgi:anti-anti-sigma factor
VLDLTAITFLDSTGRRGIVRASSLITGRYSRLTVTGLWGAVQRVLELTGFLERLREPAGHDSDGAPDPIGSATAGH